MRYKAILFDWGGVLSVGGTPDELSERVSVLLDTTPQEVDLLLRPILDSLKRGKITVDDFWDMLEQQVGRSIDVAKRDIWAPITTLQPQRELTTFVQQLQSQGYVTGILSNVFPNTADEIRAEGWYDPYSPVFLSSELGMAKPDREIYEYAVRVLNVPVNEIIFIDDQQRCLDPARELGMTTVLAHNTKQIMNDVSELLK